MPKYNLLITGDKEDKKKLEEYRERAKGEGLEAELFRGNVEVRTIITSTVDIPKKILNLPDHLRKTATTVYTRGRSNAEEVAGQTGRARAVESSYLNTLVLLGLLIKEKEGRRAYFYVDESKVH